MLKGSAQAFELLFRRGGEWLFRALAFAAGVGVLAAVTHNVIVDGVGYSSPRATVYLTIAGVVIVAAIGIGYALSRGWKWKAAGLIAGIIAFELAGLVFTAERVIGDRDAKQLPARVAIEQRNEAKSRIDALQAKLDGMTTTNRLTVALADHSRAINDASEKAALRGCASNCRKLLEAARDQAGNEVQAARQELGRDRAAMAADIQEARHYLASITVPASGSPLADRFDWLDPWMVDVAVAALYSIAGNMTACILIAMGAHGAPRRDYAVPGEVPVKASAYPAPSVPALPSPAPQIGEVMTFANERLQPSGNGQVRVSEALDVYRGWCEVNGSEPVASDEFVKQMADVTRTRRYMVALEERDAVIHGVHLQVA